MSLPGREASPQHRTQTPWVGVLLSVIVLMLAHSTLRLILIWRFAPEHASKGQALMVGALADAFVVFSALLPIVALLTFLPDRIVRWRSTQIILRVGLFCASALGMFFLVAEYFFFEEFKSRFNTVAVDYLLYPHEVFVNIWDTYPLFWVLLACAAAGLCMWLLARRVCGSGGWKWHLPWPARYAVLGCWLAAVYLAWPHVGNRLTRFSTDRTLNELAANGWYTFAQAAVTREFEYAPFYRTAELDRSYDRVRNLVQQPDSTFLDDRGILRVIRGDKSKPKLNVVLLLEESLGSEFFGCLGRKLPTCTPRIDQLSNEGLLFTNIYASGNRTVRGMEGVLCSFPPLPGDSVVVRSGGKQIETLARVLQKDGYTNTFIYAGRGAFDHVRSFMLANGYDQFIEQKDFTDPGFSTIWGVSNEDLYSRGLEECRRADQEGKPFFLTMLSVSNHEPFKYPKGRISEDPNERKRENAVKYTDYAIGQFFEQAKKEPFWTNTVFVVVADHGARVYGHQTIPMKSYEIPFLVLGPAAVKQPLRLGMQGGQVDVAPTVLGLIGRPYISAFFGRDLLKIDPVTGRSLLNHNRDIGLFEKDALVVLGLNKAVEYYKGDPKHTDLESVANPWPEAEETEKDAVAIFQVANDLYVQDGFRRYEELARKWKHAGVVMATSAER